MNAQYFIDKFTAIPDDQWRSDGYYGADGEPHCVLGHLGMRNGRMTWEFPEVHALYSILKNTYPNITTLNDSASDKFPQLTPKARVLAALGCSFQDTMTTTDYWGQHYGC